MKCPFCGKNLIEGDFRCPDCRSWAIDFDYFENLERMEEKYSKTSLLELSMEKLTFEEIVTIYTYIERAGHFGGEVSHSQDETLSNLSRQLKEMRNR